MGKKWLKEEVNLGAEGGSDPGLDERKKNEILAEPEIPARLMIKSVYYHKNL